MSGLAGLTREQAQQAAREELARRPYQEAEPPLLVRAAEAVLRRIGELLDRASGLPGGRGGLLLLLLVLIVVVAVALTRFGPLARTSRTRAALFGGSEPLGADEHRRQAEQAAAEGRWAEAVRERLRAVVRELEVRGVLDPRPGRTADEVARDAGAALPGLADALRQGATLFDEVWYGGRPADRPAYEVLVALDERVASAQAVLTR